MTHRQLVIGHDRTECISDERTSDGGIWAYLKYGWQSGVDHGVHSVHEDTWAACLRGLDSAIPCDCDDCEKDRL